MNAKNIFKADCLNGNTEVHQNGIKIYRSFTSVWPFYEKVKIKDVNNALMLEVVVTGFLGYKRKIVLKTNNLARDLFFEINKRKVELTVEKSRIVFKQYNRAFKFEGDFYVNDVYVGSIQNKLTFFTSELVYDFLKDNEINYFCIILSLILLRNKFHFV